MKENRLKTLLYNCAQYIDQISGGNDAYDVLTNTIGFTEAELDGLMDGATDPSSLDKEDVLGWIADHDTATDDFNLYFGVNLRDDDQIPVSISVILDWIYEHKTLAEDFEAYFGVSRHEDKTGTIEPEVWDCRDYVEEVTGELPCYSDVSSMERDLEEKGIQLWNYPLDEIEHAMHNNTHLCLVRFTDAYGGYEYRWCEIE